MPSAPKPRPFFTLATLTWVLAISLITSALPHPGDIAQAREDAGTLTRDVSGFDTIRLSGKFNGTIVVGDKDGLTIKGKGDLEKLFTAQVHGDELRIKLTRQGKRQKALELAITTKTLKEFIIEGAGKFQISGVDAEEFDLKLPGYAKVSVQGKCGELNIKIAGAATVDAEQLICEHGRVRISGTGTISLHASKSIDARVSGLGKIEVFGHPQEIDQHISGLGKIKLK